MKYYPGHPPVKSLSGKLFLFPKGRSGKRALHPKPDWRESWAEETTRQNIALVKAENELKRSLATKG